MFEQITPKWAEAIKIYNDKGYNEYEQFIRNNNLNISSADRCIIGEAYGFTTRYGRECGVCTNFSGKFMAGFSHAKPLGSKWPVPNEYLNEYAQEFEKHWIEEHGLDQK